MINGALQEQSWSGLALLGPPLATPLATATCKSEKSKAANEDRARRPSQSARGAAKKAIEIAH